MAVRHWLRDRELQMRVVLLPWDASVKGMHSVAVCGGASVCLREKAANDGQRYSPLPVPWPPSSGLLIMSPPTRAAAVIAETRLRYWS